MEGMHKTVFDLSPYCLRNEAPHRPVMELTRVGLPREIHTVYYLNSIPHVPHYTDRGMFVAPGGRIFSEATLNAIGAVPAKRDLWKREYR